LTVDALSIVALTPQRDAVRAAAQPPAIADRFMASLEEKVAEGRGFPHGPAA
jgi:hypothetical protein